MEKFLAAARSPLIFQSALIGKISLEGVFLGDPKNRQGYQSARRLNAGKNPGLVFALVDARKTVRPRFHSPS